MSGRFGFTRYDKDASGAEVDAATALELRRLANLFLVAGITLALFVLRAFAEALSVTFIPRASTSPGASPCSRGGPRRSCTACS